MIGLYKYTDGEIKKLLKSIVILSDTREKENGHIIGYLKNKGINVKSYGLNFGDYSYMIPACSELGINRDIYFNDDIVIERKASLEELSGNLAQQRERFENEFLRASNKKTDVVLMIEQGSYGDILNHKYRTQYNEKSFIASLLAWQIRYNIKVSFIPVPNAAQYIYYTFYYHLRERLK